MKMRGRTRRFFAMFLAFVLAFTMVGPSVLAAEEALEEILLETQEEVTGEEILEDGTLPTDAETVTQEPEVDLEAEYPYGSFAFGDFQVDLTEGDEDGLGTAYVPVYRIGGAKGRASVTILYSPAVSQYGDDEYVMDYAASAKKDLLLEIEDTDPAAKYQPLGVVRAIATEIAPVAGASEDAEHPVLLSIPGVTSIKYQWQIQIGKEGEWEDIIAERGATLLLTQEDYEANDFRCIYFDGGVNYGTTSVHGVPYVPFVEELPQIPEEGLPLDYEPSYRPAVPDEDYQQLLFDLVFAEDETVKYIKVTVLDDDELELQEMGLLTLVDHNGGAINANSSTMTIKINDNEEPVPSEIGFEVTDVTVNQDEGQVVLTVRRTGGVNYLLNVDYATQDGTAVAGKQYTQTEGTLAFLGSVDSLDIVVPLIAEEGRSKELDFSVVLKEVRGGGTDKLATLTEAVATVRLVSEGKVAELEDGLNLSSVLAQGSSDSTQVAVSKSGSLMDAEKTITGDQVGQVTDVVEAVYVDEDPDADHDTREFSLLSDQNITFSRGSSYNGWRDWEIVCDADNYFKNKSLDKANIHNYSSLFKNDTSFTKTANSSSEQGHLSIENTYESGLWMKAGHQAGAEMKITNGGYYYGACDFSAIWWRIGYNGFGGYRDRWGAPYWSLNLGGKYHSFNGNLHASHTGTGTDWKHITDYDCAWYSNSAGDEAWETAYMKNSGVDHTSLRGNSGSTSHGSVAVGWGGDITARIEMKLNYAFNYYDTDKDKDAWGLDGQDKYKDKSGIMSYDHIGLQRRVFNDKSLGVVICTANDADDSKAPTVLNEDDRTFYNSLRPTISVDQNAGGISTQGQLYVGSKIIISKPDNAPSSFIMTGAYLRKVGGQKVLTASANIGTGYSMTLLWGGMQLSDLSEEYEIVVTYQRIQTVKINCSPSVPRDKNGNSLETDANLDAAMKRFQKDDNNYKITYYSGKDANTKNEVSVLGNLLQKCNDRTTFGFQFMAQDMQIINFGLTPNDVIMYDGHAYGGDEDIVLLKKDLTQGEMQFIFYDAAYKDLPTKMVANIVSVAICYDGDGDGIISGYFNKTYNTFYAQGNDEVLINLTGDQSFAEDYFTPYLAEAGKRPRQYFLKVTYSMIPRCIDTPKGEDSNKTVRVLPAFVTSITNEAERDSLPLEQQAYRYIKAGQTRYSPYESYSDSSTGQLMYTAAASALRTVDIPLGGDTSTPVGSGKTWTWNPKYYGNLMFPFSEPEPITIDADDNVTGEDVKIAGQYETLVSAGSDTERPKYTFDNTTQAYANLNAYLGSFYAKNLFALAVNEKTNITSLADIHPETTTLGRIKTIPSTGAVNNVECDDTSESKGDSNGKNDAYPEFDMDLGFKLPNLELNVTDYVTITTEGNMIGFSIGIPLIEKKYESKQGVETTTTPAQGSGGNNSGGNNSGSGTTTTTTPVSSAGWNATSQKRDLFYDANENIQKLGEFFQNPKSFREEQGKDQKAGLKTKGFSVGFSVSIAVMFEYNPVDDCFYFKSGAVAAAAEIEVRLEARLAPCPVFYVYVVFGASIEVGTGFSVIREKVEGSPFAIKSMGNKTISEKNPATLKRGDTLTFDMKIGDDSRGFVMSMAGSVYVEITDAKGNKLKSGKFTNDYGEENEYEIYLPSSYKDKGTITVKMTALKETTMSKLVGVTGGQSKYVWNGINIAPELSVEAGAGVGMELFKFELYVKVTLGMDFTFGAYREETDDYAPATFNTFDLAATVGFNLTILFFDFSMDVIGYYLHGERGENETSPTIWDGHFGVANDRVNLNEKKDKDKDKKAFDRDESDEQFGLTKPKDISKTQMIVKGGESGSSAVGVDGEDTRAFNANDLKVPFQLSGYGASGDAFKLVDGMKTGYDYKAFSVGGESYLLYPISVGSDAVDDPIDYTQLVMCKVVVTGTGTGLQNPLDPNAAVPYLVVDELDADGVNTGDQDYSVDVDGNVVTIAFTTYASHADGNADSVSASKNVVTKKAVIDLGAADPAFTVTTLTETGSYQFLPQQKGDVTVYAGVTDQDEKSINAMMSQFSSYLQAKYNVTDADIKAAKPKAEHFAAASRYQVESIQRSIYGTRNSLFAAKADGTIVEMELPQFQTLSNIEAGKANGKLAVAYTTDQVVYMDPDGKTTSVMDANANRGVIKRLYLVTFEGSTWSEPKLLYTVIDFDEYTSNNKNTFLKDGIYVNTKLAEEKVDPYFAHLQFLRVNLSGSLEEVLLFEMNGNTYVVRESQLKNAVTGGNVTVVPIFTGEIGTEVTMGSDNNGNLVMVYVAPVAGTENNATFVAWWDSNLGAWGNGNMLAMNHMQVYEDAKAYGLSKQETSLAFYGMTTNNKEYDEYVQNVTNYMSALEQSRIKGAKDRFTFSNLQMLLDGVGADAKLVVFTSGSMIKVDKTTYMAGTREVDTMVNVTEPEIGFYAIAFSVGEQEIGNRRLEFVDENFGEGGLLAGTVTFTNTGSVGIRASSANPATAVLMAGSEKLVEWTLNENVASGSTVILPFSVKLSKTLGNGTKFYISVSEDSNYVTSMGGTPFSGTEELYTIEPKADLKLVQGDYVLGEISGSSMKFKLKYQVANRGDVTANNVKLVTRYVKENGEKVVLQEITVDTGTFTKSSSYRSQTEFTVPLSAFINNGEQSGLNLETVVTTTTAEHTTGNNTYAKTIQHVTNFMAPGNISMALGNTLYLPISYASTETDNEIVAYEVVEGRDDWEPLLGIIYYDETRGCIVAAPSKEGTGIIHVEDKKTNSKYAIGFKVTGLSTGVNIYKDNESFIYREGNAEQTLTDVNASDQDWTFQEEVRGWLGVTSNPYDIPMNNDLSVAKNKLASVSFKTVADSITLYFEGDVFVESDTFTTQLKTDYYKSPRTYYFNNKLGKAHVVTIYALAAGTKLDRYEATYAEGVDPTPVNDKGNPNVYWSRSFPDTASLKAGTSVTMTCYVTDDVALESVLWGDAEPANLTKISDALWSFDVTFTQNDLYEILVTDQNHNQSSFAIRVDWFNNVLSDGAIGTAPDAPTLSFENKDGEAIGENVIGYFPYLKNSTALKKGAKIAAYYDEKAVFSMTGAIGREKDGRWNVTSNGVYLVRITMPNGSWSQALIPMKQISVIAPTLGVSPADRAIQITASGASELKKLYVNGYPISISGKKLDYRFPVDYGGAYEVTVEDVAGNTTTHTVEMDVPIFLDGDLTLTPEATKTGGSLTISVDANDLTGGKYGTGSDAANNTYKASYEFALISKTAAGAEPNVSGATWKQTASFVVKKKGWYAFAIRTGDETIVFDNILFDLTKKSTPATCEEDGNDTMVASVDYLNVTTSDEFVTKIDKLGHDWSDVTLSWKEDNSECTAQRTCTRNASHWEKETVTTTSEVTKDPACGVAGETTYTASFTNTVFGTKTKTVANVAALAHDWNATTYQWNEDHTKCTATRTCKRNASHVETDDGTINSSVTKAATCEGKGETTYVATYSNPAFTTQSETVENVPALGHDWLEPSYQFSDNNAKCTATRICSRNADHKETEEVTTTSSVTKPATCEEMGDTTYVARYTNEGFPEKTNTVTNVDKLGHDWDAPTYLWSSDHSTCTATRICKRDSNHKETENATISSSITKAAVCEAMGETTYHAVFVNTAFEAQTETAVDVPKLGHLWDTPTYQWSDDYSTCTATKICKHDGKHVVTETKSSSGQMTKMATCVAKGEMTYEVSFADPDFEKQTKTVANLTPFGHSWTDWTVAREPSSEEEGMETRRCLRCADVETRSIAKTNVENYVISINVGVGGTASASAKTAEVGSTIRIQINPFEGYELESITYSVEGDKKVTDVTSKKSFRMPSGNVTIDVQFKEKALAVFTVRFTSEDGTVILETNVTEGTSISKPADPVREGYVFEGWYADAAFTKEFDFSKTISSGMTVYAKWTEKTEEGKPSEDKTDPKSDEEPAKEMVTDKETEKETETEEKFVTVETAPPAPEAEEGSNMLLILIIAVVAVAAVGGGFVVFLKRIR